MLGRVQVGQIGPPCEPSVGHLISVLCDGSDRPKMDGLLGSGWIGVP